MSQQEIIQAWKDEEFRLSLSEEQRALLPEHPAGLIELADSDLEMVVGGGAQGNPATGCAAVCPPTDPL